ncbi:sensor histidine kinase [Blautia sp.]|uniref:sensor histidine kinase n=1 Tax=Blautia sp. TaxID=1955243 RepID=UPI00351FDD7A
MKFHKCIPPSFSSFRYKLLLAFLIATMVPLISLTFISYHISYNIARDRIIDSAVMTDKQLVSQLNDRLGQVENVADTIQFQMYSLNQPSSNKVDALKKFTAVKNNISLYKSTFDFFHIYVFLQPDQLGSKEDLYFFSTDELSAYGLDKNIVSGSGFSSVWIPVSNMPLPKILSTKKSSADVILCVRALKNQATGILEYAYGIALDTSELTTYLQPAALDSHIYSYILTDHGEIAAKNTSSLNLSGISKAQFQKLKGNADSSFHSGDKYYNCCTLSNGWLHVTEIPESYIQGNTHILIRALLITVLIFLPLTVIIVILFSENLTRKITALSYAMEAFQLGHDPEHLSIVTVPHPDDPSRYDEIDRLGITFEDMQHTIAGNLKSIVNLSVNEERLKYQLLQSQINPHFLYNILGSIRTCQSLGKLDIADQMIANLTAFYRLTLRKSKELIPIKDELEIARLYLEMEKLCHKDNLDWEIEAEDGIENFLICKFTLQPFLENSILHGISSGTPAVFISIHVLYGDDTVVISIEDNGAGMDSETLAQLRHAIEHNVIDYEKHFGISNVSSRISNPLYGNGSVRIRSNPGNGTYVTIEFEQMEEDIDEKNNDRR